MGLFITHARWTKVARWLPLALLGIAFCFSAPTPLAALGARRPTPPTPPTVPQPEIVTSNAANLSITKSAPVTTTPSSTLVYALDVTNGGPDATGGLFNTTVVGPGMTILDGLYSVSQLQVSGFPGNIDKATVQVNGFQHTWPEDVDMYVVAPNGTQSFLMSDVGGNIWVYVNLLFDNAAQTYLPCFSTGFTSGIYHPTDCLGFGADPNPPPPANLDVFNGINPNGTWQLIVSDDAFGDSGSIDNWAVTLYGGVDGTVTVTDTLPTDVTFIGASGTDWNCNQANGVVTCTHAELTNGQAAPTIWVTTTAPNTEAIVTNIAEVRSRTSDLVEDNNIAAATTVIGDNYDVALTKVGPAFAAPGDTLVYTLTATNQGPGALKVLTSTLSSWAAIPIGSNPVTRSILINGFRNVRHVRVLLNNFSHTWPDDVDVLLVSPSGAHSLVLSDPAGADNPVSHLDFEFDNLAAGPLPCSDGTLEAGVYLPTNCDEDGTGDGDSFPGAPSGPYLTDFSVFNYTDPNGFWRLYVRDDFPVYDNGMLQNGWSLQLQTGGVIISDTLPPGAGFVSAGGAGWLCQHVAGIVTCARDTLNANESATVWITVTAPLTAGMVVNTASIPDAYDISLVNNLATAVTTLNAQYGITLTPPSLTLVGMSDRVVTGTFTLNNWGNANDVYTVTVAGLTTFTTTVPAATDAMVPGLNLFPIGIAIPANTPNGTTDTATITLTSHGDPTKTATVTLTIIASDIAVYLPIIRR